MGNCNCIPFSNNNTTSEIAPFDFVKSTASTTTAVFTSSSVHNSTLTAYYLRFALMYKAVSLQLVESPQQQQQQPTLQIGDEVVSGSRETLLRLVEARLPQPPLTTRCEETTPLLARMVALQHRSVMWHIGRLLRWANDLATRGRKMTVHPAIGTLKMEFRKFGDSYSQLLDLMLEHAQMEERVVFPLLELAEKGLCKAANEEHGRDLPVMNGIKEFVKSILVLDTTSPAYRDALSNLSTRLKSLQENCKEHFEEEEREVLPLIEAVELNKEQTLRILERCFDMMQRTHSDLFNFLIEGLLPCEAFQYLELILKCKDEELVTSMLHGILE